VHYNRPGFLKQAIASLMAQTFSHFELVVVDDGSSDPAATAFLDDLERSWSAPQKLEVLRTANRYLGAARNTGAMAARGRYILFMDDDDYAKPHQLEVSAFVAEYTNASVLTTGHDLLRSSVLPTSVDSALRYVPLGSAVKVGALENCFGDSNMFVRKSYFLASGGFTEDYGVGFEDYEYLAKVSLSGVTIQVVADPLHWYRKHGDSMSSETSFERNQRRFLRAYENAFSDLAPVVALAHAKLISRRAGMRVACTRKCSMFLHYLGKHACI
jgi:glycosyltransferase involved in cell wall biosynthesis